MHTESRRDNAMLRLRPGARVAAVASSYHADLVGSMLRSAKRELFAMGLSPEDWIEVWVPGAFELALVARRLAVRDDVDAVLCLGLVLKGETVHNQYIAEAAARGVLQVSLETDKPVIFGVLTCDTVEQARARADEGGDGKGGDKGRETARAAALQLLALEQAASLGTSSHRAGFVRRAPPPGEALP